MKITLEETWICFIDKQCSSFRRPETPVSEGILSMPTTIYVLFPSNQNIFKISCPVPLEWLVSSNIAEVCI